MVFPVNSSGCRKLERQRITGNLSPHKIGRYISGPLSIGIGQRDGLKEGYRRFCCSRGSPLNRWSTLPFLSLFIAEDALESHIFLRFSDWLPLMPAAIDVLWQTRYCLPICTMGGPSSCPKFPAIQATLPRPPKISHEMCRSCRRNNDFFASKCRVNGGMPE